MPKIKLTNASDVIIHGKRPGDTWLTETDADGVVLDPLWRKRLKDEENFGVGAIIKVVPEVPAATQPVAESNPPDTSDASSTSSRKKG
jgi:hypothetical protein